MSEIWFKIVWNGFSYVFACVRACVRSFSCHPTSVITYRRLQCRARSCLDHCYNAICRLMQDPSNHS